MMRRMVSMLLVLCMILPMLPIQALAAGMQNTEISTRSEGIQNPFSDVKETDWFYESVLYAFQNGLFKGTSDTVFSPHASMTRAMYVTVMGRIAEINPDDYKGRQEFSDVPAGSWYAPYVNWAKTEGITLGVGNGRFDPDGLVTREQMAVLIVRFYDAYKIPYPEATVKSYPIDLNNVSDYAREAVLKLWGCGLFQGDGTGCFNPKSNATRAEAAKLCILIDEAVEKWFIETGKKPAAEAEEPEKDTTEDPLDSEEDSDEDPDSDIVSYVVKFMDGDRQVGRFTVIEGEPLSKTPSSSKTAKDGHIFVGWFSDKECTVPFYAEDPVTSNRTVYAKYEEIVKEELSITSFTLMDQSPDLSFGIQKISQSAEDINDSLVLTVMDGTDPVELDITESENGTLIVKAKGGFMEGSSYRLTLGDGYIFKEKAESIRTVNFSIEKEQADNLVLNDDIIYIQDTDEISYIDIKNYSAVSVDVKIYTVEKEEDSLWTKLKGIKDGSYKEYIEKIEALNNKIAQAKKTAENIQGYLEDLENTWAAIPSNVTNKEEYEKLLDTLGELNVTQEMMGMLNLASDTELDAGVRNLMERYSEMLENDSDWIEILNKEIFKTNIYITVFAIRISANFVIKGNINIALGANMEYVIGKRYSFWFDIISKTSGSSEMDLLDEKFAFQFYVMGKLGLKMGIEAEIAVGIISTKIGSIGLTAEFGPYVEMWGYFIYEYTRLRPANTSTWNYDEKMMGALYLEFGLYLEMTFKAQAFGNLFKYEPTLLDKKWPLLTAGTRNNVYDFAYEIAKDEILPVRDHDNNSANGITMTLPEAYRQMEYIDLCEGDIGQAIYDLGKFNYTLSNRNFAFNKDNGEISVTVPKGVQYMECDLILTWKMDKLAFSRYDITVTIPLVWTNLSTEEMNERFTASVRAGNAQDGYTTVWSKRVRKNAPFDLPTEDEIRAILGVDRYESVYGNLKYSEINGYGEQQKEGLTILRDKSYYFEVTPGTYTLTVKDVEKPDGTKEDRQFTAKFGEAFDLGSLVESGTNDDENRNYTAFLKVIAKDSSDNEILRDVNEPIGRAFALEILDGANYTAAYADNSATVTFQFKGIDLEDIKVIMKKGDVASSEFFDEELYAKNAIVKGIYPAFAPISVPTTYIVVCEEQETPLAIRTITFNTNGGSEILSASYPVGSVIGKPADPVRTGYNFVNWYSDSGLTQQFDFTSVMPDKDITLYAKWSGKEYTVTFDANEGTLPEGDETRTVIFGQSYGDLPAPSKTGSYFKGWFTERTGGERVTGDTVVTAYSNHTLYAQWGIKPLINEDIIIFEAGQSYDYNGEHQPAVIDVVYGSDIDISSFTVKYKRQGPDSSWSDTAVNAGLYDVQLVREEDDTYDYFEKVYVAVMTINKINRTIDATKVNLGGSSYKANLLAGKLPEDAYPGDGTVIYAIYSAETPLIDLQDIDWQDSRVFMNLAAGDYYIIAKVLECENYLETGNVVRSDEPVTVEGLPAGIPLGYNYELFIVTSDIASAGTDANIGGRLYFLDGTLSPLTNFNNSGNDFERGDGDFYLFAGPIYHAPWMIQAVELVYVKNGTAAAGWHCDHVMPYAVLSVIYNLWFKMFFVGGGEIPVNRWFEDDVVVWKGNAASMERRITEAGNFGDIIDELVLSSRETGSYTFEYDGLVIDQYAWIFDYTTGNFVVHPYNAFNYEDAPTMSITANDRAYNDCLDYSINTFTIDKEALYEAMKAKGDTEITLTVTLTFPERSAVTREDSKSGISWYNTWTETIRVVIED